MGCSFAPGSECGRRQGLGRGNAFPAAVNVRGTPRFLHLVRTYRIQLSRSRLFATLPTLWECLVPVSLLQDYTEPPDKPPTRTRGSTGGAVNVEPGVVLRVRTL